MRLAGDLQALATMRATLRERMQSSPLMSYGAFTSALEGLYREIWIDWAGRVSPPR